MTEKIMKRPGKDASEQEKQKWEKYLESETVEQRTKRVLEPRIQKLLTDMNKLAKAIKSSRYQLSEEQGDELINVLSEYIVKIETAIEGNTNEKVEFAL